MSILKRMQMKIQGNKNRKEELKSVKAHPYSGKKTIVISISCYLLHY